MGLHFQNATRHKHELFAAIGLLDAHGTGLDAGDQRNVAGQNAQFTRFARQGHELGLAREDRLFGADHIDVDGAHRYSSLKGEWKASSGVAG
ncbi:hypothetical protein D9M69_681810 [compost metagenome]